MSNRTTIILCVAIIFTIATLIAFANKVRPKHIEQAATSGQLDAEREPAPLPIPSPPTTALPVISTEPPSTTTSRPAPTTTTTYELPEPGTQGAVGQVDESVSLDDFDMEKWREIALCEMPGPGGVPSEPWGAHWSFVGSPNGFSGALGIANSTWRAYGGSEYGRTAGNATWQQQIIVARRIRDAHGYGAWGCG